MADNQLEVRGLEEPRFSLQNFVIRDWPYIAMLALALLGVALASVIGESMTPYWTILVPFFGAVCVLARWRESQHQALLRRLIRIEALHWGAVLIAMRLVFVADVRQMMSANSAALMEMTLLALGTFTAGAQIGAWRICLVGVVLALGVPVAAWLQRTALLLSLITLVVVALVAMVYLHHKHEVKKTT